MEERKRNRTLTHLELLNLNQVCAAERKLLEPMSNRQRAVWASEALMMEISEGTIKTVSGETHSGTMVWDRDESHTWENLDGDLDHLDYSIPFANISFIERDGARASRVTVRGGQVLVLSNSNDVDENHKGLVVTTARGEVIELDWMEVERVDFN